jgi:hypothetical protein
MIPKVGFFCYFSKTIEFFLVNKGFKCIEGFLNGTADLGVGMFSKAFAEN